MIEYTDFDRQFIRQRAAQYRDQLNRWQQGQLSEDEFRPLRLQNGWYVQRHAPMLRVAVPWGELSAKQLRVLATIARNFDRGYAHLTTRQNLQYNWIPLDRSADVMDLLASVDMHGIQTSGNCVRNITCDPLAGVAADELFDVRPYAEIVRQWSSLHPEFSFLPRKFKIAMSGATDDRAALRWHDIGVQATVNAGGEHGFKMFVGGGMGRTPVIAPVLRAFLPANDLLLYIEAVLRTYNAFGRRDNIYKARIKILVKAEGQHFIDQVEAEYQAIISQDRAPSRITTAQVNNLAAQFKVPSIQTLVNSDEGQNTVDTLAFKQFVETNVQTHRVEGFVAVVICVKGTERIAGDLTADQMDSVALMAERFSSGELRVLRDQNLLLPWVPASQLHALFSALQLHGLTEVAADSAADLICCPGGDFCALANARSIPVAQSIQLHLSKRVDGKRLNHLDLHISGCINSCGHHHSGAIGVLGVDKDGQEFYQVSVGGSDGSDANGPAQAGRVVGPSFAAHEVPAVVDALLDTFRVHQINDERFIETVRRVGNEPFKLAAQEVRAQQLSVPKLPAKSLANESEQSKTQSVLNHAD
jgi:sulfite reductase (NADPH) hemoprotein beta-component